METAELLSFGFIVLVVTSSVWLAYIQSADAQPTSAGQSIDFSVHRPLNAGEGEGDDLRLEGRALPDSKIYTYGLRVLVGLITSAALLLGRPEAIYAAVAATAIWLLLPLMDGLTTSRGAFLVLSVGVFVTIGAISFLIGRDALNQFASPSASLLPVLAVGPFHADLNAGKVTPAAVWLNLLAACGVLIGVMISAWRHLPSKMFGDFLDFFPANKNDSVPAVAFMGSLVGALLLMALSTLQHLSGLALAYRTLAELAFGALLIAFIEHAIVGSRVEWEMGPLQFDPISFKSVPQGIRRPPARARGIFASFARTIVVLLFGITRGVVGLTYALLNSLIAIINLLIGLLVGLINFVIGTLVWFFKYLVRVLGSVLVQMTTSLGDLYRVGTAGLRVALFGPALMLGASILLATCANAGIRYLGSGDMRDFGVALLAFAAGSLGVVLAATLVMDWSVLGLFLKLLQDPDYIPYVILFFAVYLDLYGLSRLVLHAPSHFGRVSIALNIIVGVAGLIGLPIWLSQKKDAEQSQREV